MDFANPFLVLMMALAAAGLALWCAAVYRWAGGRPLIPFQSRRLASWGLLDLAGAVFLWALASGGAMAARAKERGLSGTIDYEKIPPDVAAELITAGAVGGLIAVVISAMLVRLRGHEPWFVMQPRRIFHDLGLGTIAFLMLAPLVYLVQGVLVYLFEPTRHPFVTLLQKTPPEELSGLLIAVGFSAVLAAPIIEEYLYRGLLQGWIEKLTAGAWPLPKKVLGQRARKSDRLLLGGDVDAPLETDAKKQTGAIAILVSSALFAAMHWSHGPDPAALFVLAVGLGYLYRRTHRLLPCIVVHLLNNALSFGMLWWEVT